VYHVVSVDRYEKAYDDYSIIMVKALADRLAEVMLRRLTFDVLLPVLSIGRAS